MTVRGRVTMPPKSAFDAFQRESIGRLQAAALNATAAAARKATTNIRNDMVSANLGRLGQAIGAGSDAEKTGRVHPLGAGWSASGWIFVRSRSPRTLGALESYTQGSVIVPRRGRFLWIATDDVKRLVGVPVGATGSGTGRARVRLEPYLWDRTYGQKLGPLVPIMGTGGTPLLVVRGGTLSLSGKAGSARPLTKRGKVPKGQFEVPMIVAFVGIPQTSRTARVDVAKIVLEARRSLPALIEAELKRR